MAADPGPVAIGRSILDPPATAAMITYTVPDDLPIVRDFARRRAASAGLGPDRMGELMVVVSELASNTIRHVGGPGVLHVWQIAGQLLVQVTDSGVIPDDAVGDLVPADPSRVGGFGLMIVRWLCDEVHVRQDPATVQIRLRLGQAS